MVYGVWCVYSVYGACMVCVCAYMCVWCGVRICVRVCVCACERLCVWCMRVLTVLAVLGPGPPAVVVRFPSDLRGRARLVALPAWTWKKRENVREFLLCVK